MRPSAAIDNMGSITRSFTSSAALPALGSISSCSSIYDSSAADFDMASVEAPLPSSPAMTPLTQSDCSLYEPSSDSEAEVEKSPLHYEYTEQPLLQSLHQLLIPSAAFADLEIRKLMPDSFLYGRPSLMPKLSKKKYLSKNLTYMLLCRNGGPLVKQMIRTIHEQCIWYDGPCSGATDLESGPPADECAILALWSRDPYYCKVIGNNGGIAALVRALSVFSQHASIQETACLALANLCCWEGDSKSANACDTRSVGRRLSTHSSPELTECRQISAPTNAKLFQKHLTLMKQAHAVAAVVQAMQFFPHLQAIQSAACDALRNMASLLGHQDKVCSDDGEEGRVEGHQQAPCHVPTAKLIVLLENCAFEMALSLVHQQIAHQLVALLEADMKGSH
jgi:Armadillo/beta-catenin-like repeat